ncbi:uncharacterized protein LOC122650818 [Telopea speciosissima]|uniref:uncharacterized protein LOC122650818 n=1 Tax=Telopea speciosissima TaxID=54955 RepID=UPI001CC48C84|nr:uncharacterized protein LOC122650818 [Telopea speciosissima]
MDNNSSYSHSKVPQFDGTGYDFWRIRMETYLKSLGYGVWMSVKNGYKIPTSDITDTVERKTYENNSKTKNALLSALVNTEFARVVGCETAKEVWDKLQNVHEGDEKIKEAKVQHYRSLFDNLKMSDEDTVESFMSKVHEIINAIRSLGEEIKAAVVVKKILRSLPDLYNPKVSAIEESKNLNELSLDELHGILTAYKMRMVKPKSTEKEFAFKAMNKLKIKQENDNEDSDDELIAYLARKFKNGKDELTEVEDYDDELMFVVLASNDNQEEEEKSDEDEQSEAKDLKTIFYTTLNELKIERKKSKMLEKQLAVEGEKISQLKLTIEETQKMTEDISINLSLKVDECAKLEEEIVKLKVEVEILKNKDYLIVANTFPIVRTVNDKGKEVSVQETEEEHDQASNGASMLDDLLSRQRPINDKSGLGYENRSSSKRVKIKGNDTAHNPVRFVREKRRGSRHMNSTSKKVDEDGFTTSNRM